MATTAETKAELLRALDQCRAALEQAIEALEEDDDEGARSALKCAESMARAVLSRVRPAQSGDTLVRLRALVARLERTTLVSPPTLTLIEGGRDG